MGRQYNLAEEIIQKTRFQIVKIQNSEEMLALFLAELRIMNFHLAAITDEVITEADDA